MIGVGAVIVVEFAVARRWWFSFWADGKPRRRLPVPSPELSNRCGRAGPPILKVSGIVLRQTQHGWERIEFRADRTQESRRSGPFLLLCISATAGLASSPAIFTWAATPTMRRTGRGDFANPTCRTYPMEWSLWSKGFVPRSTVTLIGYK